MLQIFPFPAEEDPEGIFAYRMGSHVLNGRQNVFTSDLGLWSMESFPMVPVASNVSKT